MDGCISLLDPVVGKWQNEWTNGNPPPNVWIGASVEDQARADERIPELLKIPATVHWLSCEPLIGPINLEKAGAIFWDTEGNLEDPNPTLRRDFLRSEIAWCVVGGESGRNARPCSIEWIRDIVRQCKSSGVPCFVKQIGSNPMSDKITAMNYQWLQNVRHPKGGDMAEWPEDLRVREFPKL